jgi:hypothetical protein
VVCRAASIGSSPPFLGFTHIWGKSRAGKNAVRHWMLGVEGDWDATNPSSSFCRTTDFGPPCIDTNRGFLTMSEKTEWLSSVRGRLW